MSNKRIILISGYARSGKDSLANALLDEFGKVQKEATVTKFANALKAAVQLALNELGLGHIDAFTEDPKLKALLRPLFVEVGKAARAIDKDVFVKRTLKDVGALLEQGKEAVMISDCRYLNEAQLVRRFCGERGIYVSRLHITRIGTQAANEEEEQSLKELNRHDHGEDGWHFQEGDTAGIKAWAKRLVRPWGDAPDWLKEGNKGAPVDPTKVTAYLPHGVRTSWHGPNGEPLFIDKTKPVFGHTHDPKPAPVEQQLKALWDESLCLDETIDRVSQKVDSISDRLATQYNADEDLFKKMNELNATLERIDARLKRLEVARG